MKKTIIYIPPKSENYTGYAMFVLMGTSTSDISFLPLAEQGDNEENEKEYVFPESREERFLDKDLLEFYKKKGYELKE